jgi:hypothetical protein
MGRGRPTTTATARIPAAVAVAVEAIPQVVLDEQYRIVEASPAAEVGFGRLRGHNLLERFPGSRPLFLPYLKLAQRTGRVVTFAQYFNGYVGEVKIVPTESTLTVSWERLCMLDVLTLDGLRASLHAVLDTLRVREDALHREVARSSLRVVEGGR